LLTGTKELLEVAAEVFHPLGIDVFGFVAKE
jgi:hypothetical protein